MVAGERADPNSETLGRGARPGCVELPVGHSWLTPWGQVLPGKKVMSFLDRRGSFEMFLENFFEVRFSLDFSKKRVMELSTILSIYCVPTVCRCVVR